MQTTNFLWKHLFLQEISSMPLFVCNFQTHFSFTRAAFVLSQLIGCFLVKKGTDAQLCSEQGLLGKTSINFQEDTKGEPFFFSKVAFFLVS